MLQCEAAQTLKRPDFGCRGKRLILESAVPVQRVSSGTRWHLLPLSRVGPVRGPVGARQGPLAAR